MESHFTAEPDGIKQEVKSEDENKSDLERIENGELTIKDEIKAEPMDDLDISSEIRTELIDELDIKKEIKLEPDSQKMTIEGMEQRFKQRRKRTPYNRHQLLELEKEFKVQQFVHYKARCKIATTLELTELQVKVWFQNRRAKDKRIEAGLTSPWSATRWVTNGASSSKSNDKSGASTPTLRIKVEGDIKTEDLEMSATDDHKVKVEIVQGENGKFRQKRTNFSTEQLEILEREFSDKKYLSFLERCQLASKLKLTETQVQVWFQNRRSRWKKIKTDTENPDGNKDVVICDDDSEVKIKDEPVWSESEPIDNSGLQPIGSASPVQSDLKLEPVQVVEPTVMEKSELEMISDAIRALSGADEDLHRGEHVIDYSSATPSLAVVKDEPVSPEDSTTEYPALELLGGNSMLPSADIIDLSIPSKILKRALEASQHVDQIEDFNTSLAIKIKDEPLWTDDFTEEAVPKNLSKDAAEEQGTTEDLSLQPSTKVTDTVNSTILKCDSNLPENITLKTEPDWPDSSNIEDPKPIDLSEHAALSNVIDIESVKQPIAEPMEIPEQELLVEIKEESSVTLDGSSGDVPLSKSQDVSEEEPVLKHSVGNKESMDTVELESFVDIKEEPIVHETSSASPAHESQSDSPAVVEEHKDSTEESNVDPPCLSNLVNSCMAEHQFTSGAKSDMTKEHVDVTTEKELLVDLKTDLSLDCHSDATPRTQKLQSNHLDLSQDSESKHSTGNESVQQPIVEPMDTSEIESLVDIKKEPVVNDTSGASPAHEPVPDSVAAVEEKDSTEESSMEIEADASTTEHQLTTDPKSEMTEELAESKKESLADVKQDPQSNDCDSDTSLITQSQLDADSITLADENKVSKEPSLADATNDDPDTSQTNSQCAAVDKNPTASITEESKVTEENSPCELTNSTDLTERKQCDGPLKDEDKKNVSKIEPEDNVSMAETVSTDEKPVQVVCSQSNGI